MAADRAGAAHPAGGLQAPSHDAGAQRSEIIATSVSEHHLSTFDNRHYRRPSLAVGQLTAVIAVASHDHFCKSSWHFKLCSDIADRDGAEDEQVPCSRCPHRECRAGKSAARPGHAG